LFAALYLASGRNLWLPILVHGVIDTSSVVMLYSGFLP
jgi:membrane protease YdiL (CAAX protease family)